MIPTAAQLASLVSRVTETMFGMSFGLSDGDPPSLLPWDHQEPWRTAVLSTEGTPPLTVAVSSDEPGGAALGAAMFGCTPSQADVSMVEDSLRELANIIAGQVKGAIGLQQALGLPKILPSRTAPSGAERQSWHAATLKNRQTEVTVWVAIAGAV